MDGLDELADLMNRLERNPARRANTCALLELAVSELRARLTGIRQLADLDSPYGPASAARDIWLGLAPGRHKWSTLEPLARASPLLSRFRDTFLSFHSVEKFSQEQLGFAEHLNNVFAANGRLIKRLDRTSGRFGFNQSTKAVFDAGFERLSASGVAPGYFCIAASDGNFTVVEGQVEPGNKALLRGDWLTALTYNRVERQFRKRGTSGDVFEIYSELTYGFASINTDPNRPASDFDVLARFGQSIIYVECKSGALNLDGAGSVVRSTLTKIRKLEDQLRPQAGDPLPGDAALDRHYFLLCIPHAHETLKKIATAFAREARLQRLTAYSLHVVSLSRRPFLVKWRPFSEPSNRP